MIDERRIRDEVIDVLRAAGARFALEIWLDERPRYEAAHRAYLEAAASGRR